MGLGKPFRNLVQSLPTVPERVMCFSCFQAILGYVFYNIPSVFVLFVCSWGWCGWIRLSCSVSQTGKKHAFNTGIIYHKDHPKYGFLSDNVP